MIQFLEELQLGSVYLVTSSHCVLSISAQTPFTHHQSVTATLPNRGRFVPVATHPRLISRVFYCIKDLLHAFKEQSELLMPVLHLQNEALKKPSDPCYIQSTLPERWVLQIFAKVPFFNYFSEKRKENTCSANIKIFKNKNLLIPILQLARFPHHYHLLIFYDAASMWFLDRYSKTITNDERSTDMALNCQINNDVSPKNAIFTKQRNRNTNQCNFHSEQQQK